MSPNPSTLVPPSNAIDRIRAIKLKIVLRMAGKSLRANIHFIALFGVLEARINAIELIYIDFDLPCLAPIDNLNF